VCPICQKQQPAGTDMTVHANQCIEATR
jgi:hypothetical protein